MDTRIEHQLLLALFTFTGQNDSRRAVSRHVIGQPCTHSLMKTSGFLCAALVPDFGRVCKFLLQLHRLEAPAACRKLSNPYVATSVASTLTHPRLLICLVDWYGSTHPSEPKHYRGLARWLMNCLRPIRCPCSPALTTSSPRQAQDQSIFHEARPLTFCQISTRPTTHTE